MKLKYIRFNDLNYVMFSSTIPHDVMARKLNIPREDINSAGFMECDNVKLSGHSETLAVPALPDDILTLYSVT